MWERWNAPDYKQLPEKGLAGNFIVASFAGMLHGSEGVTIYNPDALSSPQVSWAETVVNQNRKYNPVTRIWHWWRGKKDNYRKGESTKGGYFIPQWKHVPNKFSPGFRGYNGVGDDRFLDMLDKGFGKEYALIGKDYPMDVNLQKNEMQQCLMAGWAEVIRGFGPNKDGGFGIEKSKPREDIKGFSSLPFKCDDMWVTNESIAVGWTDNINSLAQAARLAVKDTAAIQTGNYKSLVSTDRLALLRISQRIRAFNAIKSLRYGTDLAQGYIGSYGKVKTGNHYTNIASYVEPEKITDLSEDNDLGMDKKAWFGFFNRSHSEYWCKKDSVDILSTTRSRDDMITQKTCAYLADRFYEGTWSKYKGNRSEKRTISGESGGKEVSSVCSLFGKEGKPIDSYPTHLHPGYVEEPYARNNDGVLKSIVNWCKEIPVIDYIADDSGEMKKNWVKTFKEWDEKINLSGSHLGQNGKIIFACNSPQAVQIPPGQIKQWNSLGISFLPPKQFEENAANGDSYDICIEREDGVKSVGAFLVVYQGKEKEPLKISGTITSTDGDALTGATASVEIENKKHTGTSGSDGKYQIVIPKKVQLPDSVFVMAAKKDFNTASKTISKKKFDKADFTLSAASKYLVQIDQGLHHLGNGKFGGSINSQFQHSSAEGTRFKKSFELDEEQLPPYVVGAKLLLSVKGAEENNPVIINGENIGVVNSSNGDGSASVTALEFDICTLKADSNAFAIASADSNANSDIDDFEFTNVQLVLTPAGDIKGIDNKYFAKISSVTVTDSSFQKKISTVSKDGRFWITAKGKSRCANAKGLAKAVVYPKGTGEANQKSVLLIETDPGSSAFRSTKAVSVASLGAKEGQTIVIRAGMRGTNLTVNDPNAEKIKELKRKLGIVRAAKEKWDSLRDQWTRLSDYIDEQRAAGNDVSDLMRNLRPITAQIQTARADYVALTHKLGTIKSLQAEIKKLDPSYVPQSTSPDKRKHSPVVAKKQPKKAAQTPAGSSQVKQKKPTSPTQGASSPGSPNTGNASAPGKPKQKQALLKPARWDAYKLKVEPRGSGLPNIDVVKIAFNRTSTRAEMRIRHYPVSLLRDEKSGIISYAVNWRGGDIADQQSANNQEGMKQLSEKASKLRQGTVSKAAIARLIKQQLGKNSLDMIIHKSL